MNSWYWMKFRSKLHRFLHVHWFKINGAIPGRMCYFCGAWTER